MTEIKDELSMPHFEDRLWGELEALHRQRNRAAPDRHVRRRVLFAGVVAAAAAVVVVVVSLWTPSTSPGPDRRSPSSEAAAPLDPDVDVVQRVRSATAVPGESIVHTTVTSGGDLDNREAWYDQVTAAARHRTTTVDGAPLTDAGWPEPPAVDAEPAPGAPAPDPEIDHCDPATKLAVDAQGRISPCETDEAPPPQPDHAFRYVDHCDRTWVDGTAAVVVEPGWGILTLYLGTGHIVQDGTEVVDGRALYRLRNRTGTYVFLVDPETYLPIRMTVTADPSATYYDMNGEPTDPPPTKVTSFEYLPRTEEQLALLTPPVPDGYEERDEAAAEKCVGNDPYGPGFVMTSTPDGGD